MSKKYRLKKWYPSLPKEMPIGFEVIKDNLCNYLNSQTRFYPLASNEVENNHEFWEEIIEKEWKIIDYYSIEGVTELPWIRSVKRIFDDVTFCINDKIKVEGSHIDNSEMIIRIELNKEGVPCLFTNTFRNNGININKAVKYEKIITTEDGINIFEGDEFFTLILEQTGFLKKHGIYKHICKKNSFKNISDVKFKVFSTERSAKDWIELNKPIYSKKDLLDASIHMQYGKWFIDGLIKRINK